MKNVATIPVSMGDYIDIVTITTTESLGLSESQLKDLRNEITLSHEEIGFQEVYELVKSHLKAEQVNNLWFIDDALIDNDELQLRTLNWAFGVGEKSYIEYVEGGLYASDRY